MKTGPQAPRPGLTPHFSRPPAAADDRAARDEGLSRAGEVEKILALLADEDHLFRELLRTMLARHFPDIAIAEAGDGGRAAALDELLHPQLVFMDINLPDGNGLELTRRFKALDPDVQVCLFTQYDIPEYRIAARECGADQVIVKEESTEAAIVAMVKAGLSGLPTAPAAQTFDEKACVPETGGP